MGVKINSKNSYTMGRSIIVVKDDIQYRFIKGSDKEKYMMFHTQTIPNENNLQIKKKITPYITFGCLVWDESGYCKGHTMTREKFIEQYCENIIPEKLTIPAICLIALKAIRNE